MMDGKQAWVLGCLGAMASGFFFLAGLSARNRPASAARKPVHRVQASAPPSASTSVDIPVQGSVKDSIGRTYAAAGTLHVEITEPAPVPVPVPVPSVITISGVTDMFGAPLTSGTAGKVLYLKGTGFPNPISGPPFSVAYTRLTLAGKTMGVSAWTATSVEFGISNVISDTLAAPLSGEFAIFQQVNGTWLLRGHGGRFTILPSPRVGTATKGRRGR
jgi:hypothetical protein